MDQVLFILVIYGACNENLVESRCYCGLDQQPMCLEPLDESILRCPA